MWVWAVDLIALLLLLVGYLERRGISRRDHRQPRYEPALAMLAVGAALADASGLQTIGDVLCVGAAMLALVRTFPWCSIFLNENGDPKVAVSVGQAALARLDTLARPIVCCCPGFVFPHAPGLKVGTDHGLPHKPWSVPY
jgi:hypothetical protein